MCVESEREALKRPNDGVDFTHNGCISWSNHQKVTSKLEDNKIFVPPNMTYIFQPLDLTVNGCCKRLLKNKFSVFSVILYTKQKFLDNQFKFH